MGIAPAVRGPVVLGVVIVLLAAWVVISRHRRAGKKRAYWSGKTPMPDNEFAAVFAPLTPAQQRFCIVLRGAIALDMKVDAELLRPDDLLDVYLSLGYLAPASSAGLEVMKTELGLEPDGNFVAGEETECVGPFLGSKTLADYFAFYLKHWDRITSPKDAAC